MSQQHPKRPRGYYENVMREMRCAMLLQGLTDTEVVTVAAQYTGLAVASLDLSVEGQQSVLERAARMMASACLGRTAVKQGLGRAVAPLEPPGERTIWDNKRQWVPE